MHVESVHFKKTEGLTGKWVQDQIACDPSVLGLGKVVLRDRERVHATADRLDPVRQAHQSRM